MRALVGRRDELEAALVGVQRGGGVVFTGEAGVGKTHLLSEVAARCRRSGWHVEVLQTSAATSGIPMWSFFHVLPDTAPADERQLTQGVRSYFADALGSERVLLVIDDAHNLDDDSAALVHNLATEGSSSVLATVRDDEPIADVLQELWSVPEISTIAVEPMIRDDAEALVVEVLGGRCSPDVVAEVVDTSGGNPLFIREVLLDAVDAGAIEERDGIWTAAQAGLEIVAVPGDRTVRCIRRRIGRLDEPVRGLLDMVAVAGTLRARRVPANLASALDGLVRRRILSISDEAENSLVSFDHPLVGEVVLHNLSGMGRWTTIGRLIDLVRSDEKQVHGDATRVATWSDELGADLAANEWVAAAREAVAAFNIDAAWTWARRALDTDPGAHAAHRLLGEMLRHRDDYVAAAAAFSNAARTAVSEVDVAMTAVDHASMLGFQMGQPADAMAVLLDAADQVRDPVRRLTLRSEAAIMATLLGRFEDAIFASPTDAELEVADPQDCWVLTNNHVYAHTMLGRVREIDALVDRTLAFYAAVVGERPQELDSLLGLRGAARLQRGEFRHGIEELDALVTSRRERGEYRGIMAAVLSLLLDLVGDPGAVKAGIDAVEQHEWLDPFGSTPIAVAAATLAASSNGDPERANAILERALETPAGSEAWSAIWIGRAQARVAWGRGDGDDSAQSCIEAGRAALDTAHYGYAAITLHDGVLYGAAAEVAPLLRKAVEPTEGGEFLELLVRHAEAVAERDLDGLADCVGRFAALGAVRLEVECGLQLASALEDLGASVGASRADAGARHVAAQAGIVVPPIVLATDGMLSDRELEVAALAADGTPSRDVAASTFLSVRTVDNHLSNVYRKLGIDGRSDIDTVLQGRGRPPTG